MRKIYLFILLAGLLFDTCHAQYVYLPDANFVLWLQANGYSACLNGHSLDTTCSAVMTATSVVCSNTEIADLTGIQYFKALQMLDCSNDSIINIPALPATLTSFNCTNNYLATLPALPAHLTLLSCSYNFVTTIAAFPNSLQQVSCTNNTLTGLPALSGCTSLQSFSCDFNLIDSIPRLPASITSLSCSYNPLHNLPTLPAGLQNLICYDDSLDTLTGLPAGLLTLNCNLNQLSALPSLPVGLTSLQCANNNLTQLPTLPNTLQSLYCLQNKLTAFPALPATLNLLNCNSNLFTSLPALPESLQTLECAFNNLTALPALPGRLQIMDCSYNHLGSLPALPSTITTLYCNDDSLLALPNLPASLRLFNCGFNQLTFIPELPDSMYTCYLTYNTGLACLPELKRIVTFDFSNTAVACLPDYGNITNSNPALDTFPLCGMFNTTGCPVFSKINGQCFYDGNNNCKFDSLDVATNYAKVQLYSGGALQQQVYTSVEGFYWFDSTGYGNYTVSVDTSNLPFTLSCPDSDYYSVTLSATDSISYSNNFALRCHGFDVGVQSILNDYHTTKPGAVFGLQAIAGDLSQLYGAGCAAGVSGEVQLIYTGPLKYTDTAAGAISPTSVTGDTLNWTINNFANVNTYTAFNLLFQIDSTAKVDTTLCFTVTVTPTTGDYKPGNNTLTYCIPVLDSIAANEKEVYPLNSLDTANPWLTYTIRFQNKDTTIAQNIIITDTLDSHLDPATFQLLAYSAKNMTRLFANVVTFNFPNIDLPDSLTSDSLSRGYVQYKIKIRDSLAVGTQFFNTAYIQFDTNAVVMTNTTLDSLVADTVKPHPVGINSINDPTSIAIYPNPAHDYVVVSLSSNLIGSWLELTDAVGRTILQQQITTDKFRLQTGGLAKGIYLVKVESGNGGMVKKLVVE